MTSMSERGKTTRDDENITPWILVSTSGTVQEEVNFDPGVTTESLLASWSRGEDQLSKQKTEI